MIIIAKTLTRRNWYLLSASARDFVVYAFPQGRNLQVPKNTFSFRFVMNLVSIWRQKRNVPLHFLLLLQDTAGLTCRVLVWWLREVYPLVQPKVFSCGEEIPAPTDLSMGRIFCDSVLQQHTLWNAAMSTHSWCSLARKKTNNSTQRLMQNNLARAWRAFCYAAQRINKIKKTAESKCEVIGCRFFYHQGGGGLRSTVEWGLKIVEDKSALDGTML